MQKKKAVSLIVLVIVIIVMIILAGTIILSLDNSGIIAKAQTAVDKTNLKEVQALASLKWSEAYLDGYRGQQLATYVKEEIKEVGVTDDKYEITVTDSGVDVKTINDVSNVQNMANQIWTETYSKGITTQEDLFVAVLSGLKQKEVDTTLYDITVTVTDVTVKKEEPADSQVQNLAESKWEDAFIAGTRTQVGLESAVLDGLVHEGIDTTLYNITVTTTGVVVAEK